MAVASIDWSLNRRPSRSARLSRTSPARITPPSRLEFRDHVVDGVPDRLQVFEVLVVDAEPDRALSELLFQRLDQFDERKRVGRQVLVERGPLGDGGGVDLEDVGQPVAYELEHLLSVHG